LALRRKLAVYPKNVDDRSRALFASIEISQMVKERRRRGEKRTEKRIQANKNAAILGEGTKKDRKQAF
jgi:hypothetical protein